MTEPWFRSEVSVEEAIKERRSKRLFAEQSMQLNQVGQLCWAAQGITNTRGFRATPSAGALYPLEVLVVSGNVHNLEPGVYHYNPKQHALDYLNNIDVRPDLSRAALNQRSVQWAPVDIVIGAVYQRTRAKYGDRAIRYIHMEAGHAAQNIYLQAVALGLNTVSIGAFRNDQLKKVLQLVQDVEPLYIMPVGK